MSCGWHLVVAVKNVIWQKFEEKTNTLIAFLTT